ncbi:MAG: disulfide oxidoreductase [Desulfuromonas sp.]|nr:MAG: disulfide oxidoreductase [Desulfuromonas sp.]
MSNSIDKKMTFAQLLKSYPQSGKLLKEKFNLGCVGCGGAENETLAQGARAHGLDVDELIKELKTLL